MLQGTHDNAAGTHVVQFYENDRFLVDTIAGRVTDAVKGGMRAIVLATAAHLEDLEKVLAAAGIDVRTARARNQYVDLDAGMLLSRIMVDEQPNPACFNLIMGGLISGTPAEHKGVWVFCEMVALLWTRGRHEAALRLEALWNNLARTHRFSLHCAYPQHGFSGGANHERYLHKVCSAHSKLIPGESSLTSSVYRRHTIEELRRKAISHRTKAPPPDFEKSASGRYWVGMDGTILWANEAELNLFGYRRDEYVGRHISDFHAESTTAEDILRRLRSSETLHEYPARRRCKNGSIKSTLMYSAGLWKWGKVSYVCCLTRMEGEPLVS